MAKWLNLKIIRVLVPPEVLYNHMWAVMNAYNRVDFEFPVAIRASLPSATTSLERPYLLGPLGGRYIQVLLYIALIFLQIIHNKPNIKKTYDITGLILGLRPANEKRRYFVTPSLNGWAQT